MMIAASAVMVAGLLSASAAVSPTTSPPAEAAQCTPDPDTPKRQFRAMWIATVANLNWPSQSGLSVAAQKQEFRGWLDLAEQRNMNAVVVQVRPTADAFWPSSYEPWSQYLTGTQGQHPGYDPLAFLVDEAHSRGIELHAWFNPYRVANHANRNALHSSHPARQNPSWAFEYGGKLYYNPGIPTVRSFVQDAMMDAVSNYDVDGVHFDDYFYPYPVSGQSIPDWSTYQQYGGGFSSIEDWRRNNVNLLVQEMNQRIKQAKPHVAFGISPFGIWRNSATDPNGSATSGLQSYDAIYADSRKWVQQNWVDYITPQIYWHMGQSNADYSVLVPWWSDVVNGTNVQLFVGQAAYKVGTGGAWNVPSELTNHLYLNRQHPEAQGDVFFSARDVRDNDLGSISQVASDHYSRAALVPEMTSGGTPGTPTITSASGGGGGVNVTMAPGGGNPTNYAVYRVNGTGSSDPCDFDDASNLLGTQRRTGSSTTFIDTTAVSGQTYTYYATALGRTHAESGVSAGVTVEAGSDQPWTATIDNADSGFSASGNWATSSWSSQRYGANYRYANPEAVSDVAWFSADVPSTGDYLVEVWYPASSGYNSSTPFIVSTTSGNSAVYVDQRSNGGQWVSLGTFTLAGGNHHVVGVSRWTSSSGYVIADAVRITRQ
jgi:uncharacterized lipoprotein YddW (UPF0748 family)